MHAQLFIKKMPIVHFTVTGGNAGVDVVLIQLFALYYVNHVILSICKANLL